MARSITSITEVKECLASMEIPEDLRKILERYVELWEHANRCHHAIQDSGFVKLGDAKFDLRIDAVGSTMLSGRSSYADVINDWAELRISNNSAIILVTHYKEPCDVDDPSSELEKLLSPLEELGWCIFIAQGEGSYAVIGLVSFEAMMTGEKQPEDKSFYEAMRRRYGPTGTIFP